MGLQPIPAWPTARHGSQVNQGVLLPNLAYSTPILSFVSISKCWSLVQSDLPPDSACMYDNGSNLVCYSSGFCILQWELQVQQGSPQGFPTRRIPNPGSCVCWQVLCSSLAWTTHMLSSL